MAYGRDLKRTAEETGQERHGMVRRTSEVRWHQGHGGKLEGNGSGSICALGSTGPLGVIPAALILSPRGVCQLHCPQQRHGGRGAEDPGAETGLWPLLRLTPGKT